MEGGSSEVPEYLGVEICDRDYERLSGYSENAP